MKHKRIKALPVCSESLVENCAVFKHCIDVAKTCYTCKALKSTDSYCYCGCSWYKGKKRGCPYFRKAGGK